MPPIDSVTLDLVDSGGHATGTLRISLLPNQRQTSPAPLLDLREDAARDETLEPVQLLEGQEYRYEIRLLGTNASTITTDKDELFFPDTDQGNTGRLRTGFYVGRLQVSVRADSREIGRVAVEVRSRKLDYLNHYQWMLEDIATHFSELIMERFGPTEQAFRIDETRDAATLYQRFVFLKSLVTGDRFSNAVHHILGKPHRAWIQEEEHRHPGQGIPASSRAARHIVRPGARVPWHSDTALPHLGTLPMRIPVGRTEESVDTPPNRFVKFALNRWRDVVTQIQKALEQHSKNGNAPVARGLREVGSVIRAIDAVLSEELFRSVGTLTHFPSGNQVLQKQEGYRDIFQAYIHFELAARLTWEGGEDVYDAGQRNVAVLYEMWVFLQLAEVVADLTNEDFDLSRLLEETPDGLNIGLRRGKHRVIRGSVDRLGRHLQIELWFNRSFGSGGQAGGSWTRPMRPDYSIRIAHSGYSEGEIDETWVHFDAKYRVEAITGLFGRSAENTGDETSILDEEDENEDVKGVPKRTDLLKMHAYRDAIRRSSGAYVVYPGTERELRKQYHEILPGLGAFALRPTQAGVADGAGAITQFINDVIDHFATQASQHERQRFWLREVYDDEPKAPKTPAAPFLERPPADTLVLLGFVRNEAHLKWIHRTKLYNLRADSRNGSVGLDSKELAAELVVVYGPRMPTTEIWRVNGAPQIYPRAAMKEMGYPNPRSSVYFCMPLAPVESHSRLRLDKLRLLAARSQASSHCAFGAPVVLTWRDCLD